LKVGQTFRFDPTPQLSLQLSNGQTLNLNAGQSTALTFPTVTAGAASNNLTVTPTYTLGNDLANETDLIITPSYNFTPLNIAFSGSLDAGVLGSWSLPGLSLDPAGTFSWFPGDISIPLFNQSFPLQGFNSSTTAPLTIVGYTYPLPTLASVSPPAFKPGATTLLTAAGTHFVPSHTNAVTTLPNTIAQWNGANRTYQYGSPTQMTFHLSTTDANTEGIYNVNVTNPAPGGGTSNSQKVIIDGTPPVTAAPLSGPQNANNHGWYKGDVTVNLSTNDTLSGVAEVDYSVDSGAV
jgi:trimeric autotransporter adhesin